MASTIKVDVATNKTGDGPVRFPFGTIQTANVRAPEGGTTTTLTDSDNPVQIFHVNPGLVQTVRLPSANIKAGSPIVLINTASKNAGTTTTNQDLVVQSSNGTELTIPNGCNLAASIKNGYAVLRCLVDTPVAPSDWYVEDVYEEGLFSPATWTFRDSAEGTVTGGTSVGHNLYYLRHNSMVSGSIDTSSSVLATTTGTASQVLQCDVAVPTRLIPVTFSNWIGVAPVRQNGLNNTTPGFFSLSQFGHVCIFYDLAAGTWPNSVTAGLSSTENNYAFQWNLLN